MNRQITLQHIKKYLHNNKTKKKPNDKNNARCEGGRR